MDTVWKIFCEELKLANEVHNLQIHSFVLMSNHFHLIASTPEANISQAMHQFMRKTSKALTSAGNRINQTYAGRHYKCILQQHSFYMNAYKYNYRNPVSAGICHKVENYPYSTLPMVLGLRAHEFPVVEDTLIADDKDGILKWLNTAPDPEKLEAVKLGLRRQFFTAKRSVKNGLLLIGDQERL